jgi:hypothetical protein
LVRPGHVADVRVQRAVAIDEHRPATAGDDRWDRAPLAAHPPREPTPR